MTATSETAAGSAKQNPPGGGVEQSPKDLITSAASTVKQEVASFASSLQEKASDRLEEKQESATRTLGEFATVIRHAGEELAQHDQTVAGRVVKHAADGLEHFSRSVAEKPPGELLDAIREFGRENPTAFIAGSVLLGVALGRFVRSSAPEVEGAGGSSASQDFKAPPAAATQPTAPATTARLNVDQPFPQTEG